LVLQSPQQLDALQGAALAGCWLIKPYPVADMGRPDGADQGIAGFFLQLIAVHAADDKPERCALGNQGAIRPGVDRE
jgi:hypothetical protein